MLHACVEPQVQVTRKHENEPVSHAPLTDELVVALDNPHNYAIEPVDPAQRDFSCFRVLAVVALSRCFVRGFA